MPTSSSAIFNVKDIQKSLGYYKALGFKVTREWKDEDTKMTGYADLTFRGADFGVANAAANEDADFQKWVSTPLGAGVVIYFTTTSVDDIFAKAQKATGGSIEMPLTDRPYGRMFTVNDPDGYTITFLQEKRAAPARKKKAAKKAKPASKKTASKKTASKKVASKKKKATTKRRR